MKKSRSLILAVLAACAAVISIAGSPSARASEHNSHPFGLGIVLGEPTAFTGKYWMNGHGAIDFGVGYSFYNSAFFYADYLHHFKIPAKNPPPAIQQMRLYVGGGAEAWFGSWGGWKNSPGISYAGLGLRIPLGIEWLPKDPPLGVFLEIVPGIGLIPATYGFVHGGIGVRYYF